MAKGTTRKSKGPKPMTIPHLRKAFDHIDAWIESRIHKEGVKKLVPAFQAEWKKVFRRTVDTKAAEAYLSLKHTATPRVTKKHKQTGGSAAALGGAPLDYMTRQGVTGPYGSFPAYLSDGMLPYPADSVSTQCGKIDITPNVPVDIGSNKVGGGRSNRKTRRNRKQSGGDSPLTQTLQGVQSALEVFGNRPFQNSSPPTTGSIATMGAKGIDVATPYAQNTVFTTQPYNPAALTSSPALVNQNLPAQVARGPL